MGRNAAAGEIFRRHYVYEKVRNRIGLDSRYRARLFNKQAPPSLIMLATISTGQFIGSLLDAGFWIAAGVFIQFFLARYIQKRIELGKEKPEMAERIKRNGKWAGWLLILLGVVKGVGAFLGHA